MKLNKFSGYKKNTIKFFDRMADNVHGDSFKHYNNVIGWLEREEGKELLDLGTGKGPLLEKILDFFKESEKKWNLYGIDISPKMIEKALEKKLPVKFQVGDSENLPYTDSTFDVITCINSFHHYENPKNAIKEIRRVLKSDGTLILGEIWLPSPLRKLINIFLPYGTTGDYRIYSRREIATLFSQEDMVILEKKYVFPSNYTYLLRKITD